MTSFYANLVSPSLLISAEKNASYEVFSERHLQALWYEQKYFNPILTPEGETIQVLSPGIWNSGAGPDFTKAHLIIGGKELKGDVELHLAEEGWYQHDHHEDKRYNDVVLHISLWPSTYGRTILKQNHESIIQCILEPYLTIPLSRIYKLIDLDLYPYKKFLGSGRCAHSLFADLKSEAIESLFHQAALWRLHKKWEFLIYKIPQDEDFIPAGCAMALGYKHNSDQFLQLYIALKKYRDLPIDELISLALGMAGFFEERYQRLWGESEKFKMLSTLWGGVRSEIDHQANLVLHHVRPFNHPVRRLACLAYMMRDSKTDNLGIIVENAWKQGWCSKPPKELYGLLTELIPIYTDSYWNTHYIFEHQPQQKFLPLMGGDLKREILVNTLLPNLYMGIQQRSVIGENQAFETFYHAIPSSQNSKAKYLMHRFFGETSKGTCLSKVDCEQGAFQLHYDFCRHYEASCIGCPFVARYKALKNL